MQTPDVLIVGAGPVGLTLAIECQRHGVSYRLIDRNPAPSDKSKALAIWSGNIECLAAMGAVEKFLAHSMPLRRAVVAEEGRTIGEISCCEDVDSPYPLPFLLPQSETERLLAEHLIASGGRIERQVELVEMMQFPDRVECALQHPDGTKEACTVAWLAGCDGARSVIRKSLQIEFPGETEGLGFLLIDAKIQGDLPADAILASWGREYTTIFFPVKPGVFRMFTQRKDISNRETPTLEEMQRYVDQTGLGDRIKLYDPEWLSFFMVNERVAARLRSGRIFLLGDAAHIHSPAGGQGMNTGMQDAFNLGWKLALLTRGHGDVEAIAESYHAERHPVAADVIAATGKLLDVGLSHTILARVAKTLAIGLMGQIPVLQKFLSGKLSEVHIRYAQSPLIQETSSWRGSGGFEPGQRVRDAQVRDARTGMPVSLWHQFLTIRPTLLLLSGPNPTAHDLQTLLLLPAELTAKFPNQLSFVGVWHGDRPPRDSTIPWLIDPQGRAHRRYGVRNAAFYLIRPDQYVAARGQADDFSAARAWVSQTLGAPCVSGQGKCCPA